MKRFVVLLLGFILLFTVCIADEPEEETINEEGYKVLHGRKEYYGGSAYDVLYHPDMFLVTSNTGEMDPDIAKLSVVLADAAYKYEDIDQLLDSMGFDDRSDHLSYSSLNYMTLYNNDKEAYFIAHREYKGYNIYVVPIKGTSSNEEWFSDFNLNGYEASGTYHSGFYIPAREIYNALTARMSTTSNNILLLTGHSRGAAISNMVGGMLQDAGNQYVAPEHLFCYNYACPAVGTSVRAYQNIFNINNRGDVITLLPRKVWGYNRYGVDISFGPYDQDGEISDTLFNTELDKIFLTTNAYEHLHFALDFLAWLMVKDNLVKLNREIKTEVMLYYLAEKYPGEILTSNLYILNDIAVSKSLNAFTRLYAHIDNLLTKCDRALAMLDEQGYEWDNSQVQQLVNEINEEVVDYVEGEITSRYTLIEMISKLRAEKEGEIRQRNDGAYSLFSLFLDKDNGLQLRNPIEHGHKQLTYINYINRRFCGQGAFYGEEITKSKLEEVLAAAGTTIGPDAFYGCTMKTESGGTSEILIPETIRAIGSGAFMNSSGYTNLSIPNSVEFIDTNAFVGCNDVTSIELPIEMSLEGCFKCTSLESIHYTVRNDGVMPERTAPQSVSNYQNFRQNSLESWALGSLDRIVFDSGVTSISSYAFCHPGYIRPDYNEEEYFLSSWPLSLRYVELPSSVINIGDYAFYNQRLMTINHTVSSGEDGTVTGRGGSIGRYAFWRCYALTDEIIPEGVTEVKDYAYEYCRQMDHLSLPSSLTAIGQQAFYFCETVDTLVIPNGVTYIGHNAFGGWEGLKHLTIPADMAIGDIIQCFTVESIIYTRGTTGVIPDYDSSTPWHPQHGAKSIVFDDGVIRIGDGFLSHTGVTSITLPDSLESIGDNWLGTEESFGTSGRTVMLTNPIPANLRYIGEYGYFNCRGLTDVVLPDTVEFIGERAFKNSSVENITIPEGLTVIPDSMCYNCWNLTAANLPETIGEIENGAFAGCKLLQGIALPENVTVIGNEAFSGCVKLQSINIPEQLESIGGYAFRNCGLTGVITLPETVAAIGPGAFWACSKMTEIVLPEQITIIEDYTFASCSGLTNIPVPENVTAIGSNAFSDCIGLTEFILPDDIETIGAKAFSGCSGLTGMILPEGLAVIEEGAFSNCIALESISIPESITVISRELFSGCAGMTEIIIPDTVNTIEDSAFSGCSSIAEISLPDSITSLGWGTFKNCISLESIKLPSDITIIEGDIFEGCTSLAGIVIPESVTEIGSNAFSGCISLAEIQLPEQLTTIGGRTFYNCTGLTEMILPAQLTTIKEQAFEGCTGITDIRIPEGITSLSSGMFSGCTHLENVILHDNLTAINSNVFTDCTALRSISLPDALTVLGGYAFSGCTALRGITLPSGITMIDNATFRNCEQLLDFIIPSGVTKVEWHAFDGCTSLMRVTVPTSLVRFGYGIFVNCTNLGSIYYEGTKEQWNSITFAEKPLINVNVVKIHYCYQSDIEAYGECGDGIIWQLDNNGLLTIEGTGNMQNFSEEDQTTAWRASRLQLCSIYLREGISGIGAWAFAGCSNVSDIILPAELTSIGEGAFNGCNALTDIYYAGSEEMWNMITVGDCNEILSDSGISIHYNHHQADIVVSGTCGTDLSWALDTDGLLRITGSGTAMYDYNQYGSTPWYQNRSLIQSVEIDDSVTHLGNYAFYQCDNLQTVTLPENMTSIGAGAFYGCWKLPEIALPDGLATIGNQAFYGCSAFTEVIIPDTVTMIDINAFQYCSKLERVNIPEGITWIGGFQSCSSLTSITIPQSAAKIGNYAFSYCSGLKRVNIPTNVTAIDFFAFAFCSGFREISIPGSVKTVGTSSFHTCGNLEKAILGDGVTTISDYAFINCTKLVSIEIPNSMRYIGTEAFRGCTQIRDVYFTGTEAEWNAVYKYSGNECLTGATIHFNANMPIPEDAGYCGEDVAWELENDTLIISGTGSMQDYSGDSAPWSGKSGAISHIVIRNGVTRIGNYAFRNFTKLTSIEIPDSILIIGNMAFSNCSRLNSVIYAGSGIQWAAISDDGNNQCLHMANIQYAGETVHPRVLKLPDGLLQIESYALWDINAQVIFVPKGCNTIEQYAFSENEHLTYVIIREGVTEIAPSAFYFCPNLTVYTDSALVRSVCAESGVPCKWMK